MKAIVQDAYGSTDALQLRARRGRIAARGAWPRH
jgi:hypothetical protein